MLKLLKTYQKRLTNLSTNNKSLLLLRLAEKYFLDLHDLDFALNKPSFSIIQDLVAQKKKITLCSNIDSRDEKSNKVANILQQIKRTDRIIQEERGAKDLYIAYPFVQGQMIDGTLVRCPLLFFPIDLKLENNEWQIKILDTQPIRWNTTFLLAYSHYNHVNFTEEFLEQDFEEFSQEAQVFMTELYHFIEKSPLKLHFNQESFTEKLSTFKEFTKQDFTQDTKNGELRLMPQAVLGVFPIADSYLVPDYDNLIARNHIISPLFGENLANIQETYIEKETRPKQDSEGDLMTPYAIDASQEAALQAVKKGYSIVVQGPPGTGKSQLICNLVCDFLAQGKKVLVVCQKRAALDVVHQRLASKQFADFAALVHDIQADRRYIFEQIKTHIENIEAYRKKNESFDVLRAETQFEKLCKQIDKITQELTDLKKGLYDTTLCGISVKELYLTTVESKQQREKTTFIAPLLPTHLLEKFTFHHQKEVLLNLKTYLHYALLDTDDFWQKRVLFANFSNQDKNILTALLVDIPKKWQNFEIEIQENIGKKIDFQTTKKILAQENEILDFVTQEIGTTDSYMVLWTLLKYKIKEDEFAEFQKLLQKIINALKKQENIEQTLLTEDLAMYDLYLQKYFVCQEKFWGKILWKFSKEKKLLEALAQKNNLLLTPENAKILDKKIKKRVAFEKLRIQLINTTWAITFDFVAHSFDLQAFTEILTKYEKAIEAKKIWQQFSKDLLQTKVYDVIAFDKFVKNIQKVVNFCKNFHQEFAQWQSYFSENQLLEILQHSAEQVAINAEKINKEFAMLKEFDHFKMQISTHENELGQVLRQKLVVETEDKTTNIENLLQFFDHSLRNYWIEKIETTYPVLQLVSSFRINHLEEELQSFLVEKNTLTAELLHQKLRQNTYTTLQFNRLNNLVSYRDLKHQVNKKRHVFPLRKLLQNFKDEIFNLIPCWLASPETVSAMFEMNTIFDLVIFDEASQCFAEKGLPAVFRGKQVVIAGDSQQLQPFDLYRPRWEEEYDEDAELQNALEVESLLDLGANELPSFMLTGHYRSQSLDLIDFSNQMFYKNKLQMIPHYTNFMAQKSAIDYLKVNGVWEKNSNQIEANKVVDLIKNLQDSGKTNIGVITFNSHQQNLIFDTLEKQNIALADDVFIKNIENVQGDERDIIIFSLGYAPTPTGRMTMQFGLLNLAKGENRLNVAITRAKEKIYIVASIFPHQLQTEHLQNEGAKVLKSYLEYALQVSEGRYLPSLRIDNKQNIDWYLKEKLANDEATVGEGQAIDLPFADLTRKNGNQNGNQIELVLTDDILFYNALSAKEWFAYLPAQLKQKGWVFSRSWSRTWWKKVMN
jgi:superfamily I DNA and/or RNA helicase